MDQIPHHNISTPLERIAVLENQMEELKEIREKLDELIQLKHQGMGAITLVSILVGSGVLGLITTVFALLKNGVHL